MISSEKKILVIGYGNPGRLDDGLGPAFADAIENKNIAGITVDSDYQLTVEDSSSVSEHDIVVFVDASVNAQEPFSLKKITPKKDISFTTHSIDPESVLGLAYDLFNAKTIGYVLGIRGYDFNEFGMVLSKKAKENLQKAIEYMSVLLVTKKFPVCYPAMSPTKLNNTKID